MAAGVGRPDDGDDVAACARAWQTLRLAHNRVAARLATRLADGCGLALHEFDATLVRLTPAGHDLVQRAAELHAAVVRETLTDRLTPEEQAALLDGLSQIGT